MTLDDRIYFLKLERYAIWRRLLYNGARSRANVCISCFSEPGGPQPALIGLEALLQKEERAGDSPALKDWRGVARSHLVSNAVQQRKRRQ